MKRALIFGVGGQDGSYMAELLAEKGYEVFGTYRRSSVDNLSRLDKGLNVKVMQADLCDAASVTAAVKNADPDVVYNLADQDLVSASLGTPRYSVDVTMGGVVNVLEAVLEVKGPSECKVFQPCSSTVFGGKHNHYCTLDTPFAPESPYACAKAGAYYVAKMYRQRYGMHVSTAILYGHNSVRQKPEYLLHRLALDAVRYANSPDKLLVKDPGYKVDIGCAQEFVHGMYSLMNLSDPYDVILSTGKPHRVGDLAAQALYEAGAKNSSVEEYVADKAMNESMTSAMPTRAYELFAWKPKVTASDMIERLVEHYRGM